MRNFFFVATILLGMPTNLPAQTISLDVIDLVDANDDGAISIGELASEMDALFIELDSNGDSAVNWSEASTTMSRDLFSAADADGNGWISKREYDMQVKHDFDAADHDGNGLLQ